MSKDAKDRTAPLELNQGDPYPYYMLHLQSLFLNQKEIAVSIYTQTQEVREIKDLIIEQAFLEEKRKEALGERPKSIREIREDFDAFKAKRMAKLFEGSALQAKEELRSSQIAQKFEDSLRIKDDLDLSMRDIGVKQRKRENRSVDDESYRDQYYSNVRHRQLLRLESNSNERYDRPMHSGR